MKKFFHNFMSNIIEFFRKVNILPRLAYTMLCLSIIPTLFITWFSYFHYASEIKTNTEQYLSLLVKNISTQIQERLENYENIVRAFYLDPYIMNLVYENDTLSNNLSFSPTDIHYMENKKEIQKRLWELSLSNRYISNFELITDTDQYTMETSDGYARGGMLKDPTAFRNSDFYTKAIENEGYPVWFETTANTNLIHSYIAQKNNIGDTFTLTTAIYPPNQKHEGPLGVLMMNIDLHFLTHSLTNFTFYGTGNTVLTNDASILTALNPNVNAPSLRYDKTMQDIFQKKHSGEITQDVDGRTMYISFKKIRGLNLYVAHVVDLNNLLAPAYKIRNLCLKLVIFLIMICLLIAYLTTLSISVPLHSLLDNIKSFQHNWNAKRCSVSGHDELTRISNHFNEMADSTQKMSDAIVQGHLNRQALELSRTKAELNALQMQINPHFLYNTLDLIRWETIRIGNGENDASRMIDCFTSLLRKSIKKNNDKVKISEELEHAQVYLEVVNYCRNNKIELVSSLNFDSEKYIIPKLSFQPLIENAVNHGFLKGAICPMIHLRGWILQNKIILITVTDNGKGMDADSLEQLRKTLDEKELHSESIGLRNVNQRFKLCYGEEFGVTIDSVPNIGTEISLRLPIETFS